MDDDITFRIDGEKMSKNRYFFGGELKSAMKSKSSRQAKESSRKPRKTAVDIFLEDQGPYSRKLYGPPPTESTDPTSLKPNKLNKSRPRSQEALLNSGSSNSNNALVAESVSANLNINFRGLNFKKFLNRNFGDISHMKVGFCIEFTAGILVFFPDPKTKNLLN